MKRRNTRSRANRIKTIFTFALVLSILVGYDLYLDKSGYRLFLRTNGGFTAWKASLLPLDKEALSLPSDEIIASLNPSPAELKRVLSQKFSFLGRGVQSYVFIGEDEETVLKIFKNYLYATNDTLSTLPLPSFLHKHFIAKIKRRKLRLHNFYQCCVIAAYEIPELTQVSYAHLFPTENLKIELQLQDRVGINHQVNVNRVQFLLQKKLIIGDLLAKKLIRDQDQPGFEKMLLATEQLMLERFKRGIADRDFAFDKNIGFLDGKAILLDFGSIIKKDLNDPEEVKDLALSAQEELKNFEALLLRDYPDASSWLNQFFNENQAHLDFCTLLEKSIVEASLKSS